MVANAGRRLTANDVALLLEETSRTFALAVPLLSGRARLSVGLAYLLFRCADTLEDASTWSIGERKIALHAFARMLDDGGAGPEPGPSDRATIEDWLARGVSTHAGYTRLLATLPEVVLGETASPARRNGYGSALSRATAPPWACATCWTWAPPV